MLHFATLIPYTLQVDTQLPASCVCTAEVYTKGLLTIRRLPKRSAAGLAYRAVMDNSQRILKRSMYSRDAEGVNHQQRMKVSTSILAAEVYATGPLTPLFQRGRMSCQFGTPRRRKYSNISTSTAKNHLLVLSQCPKSPQYNAAK